MKDAFEKMKERSKEGGLSDRIMRRILTFGQDKKKGPAFRQHWLIEQVKGTMTASMHQPYSHSQTVSFDSKWAYWVSHLEPQHLKAQRRHTLVDFQWWNRGSIFPLHSFVPKQQ